MSQVVVVGSFNLDHAWRVARLPGRGETLSGDYASGAGGKGFNQAIACARAGAGTAFVCALGEDAAGALARQLAAEDRIALHASTVAAATGSAGIFVDGDGENSIVVAPGANAALDADFVARCGDAFVGARVVLAQLETPVTAALEAFARARATGALAMLNPAPADAATSPALLAACDLLTPNETEFAALVSRHLGEGIAADAVASTGDDTLHAMCRRLLPHGRVVVTMGAAGCFASLPGDTEDASSWLRLPAEPADARDTTGAGDAFNGALAASLALDASAPFAAHLRFASRYAALSTERAGAAASTPRRAQLVERFGV
jgi:ribokinase